MLAAHSILYSMMRVDRHQYMPVSKHCYNGIPFEAHLCSNYGNLTIYLFLTSRKRAVKQISNHYSCPNVKL